MSNFKEFRNAMEAQVKQLSKTGLFVVDIDKDELWNLYLDTFPAGTNLIFRNRREYDCSCCRQFVKTVGNLVTIKDNKLVSVWDIEVGGYYQPVANALAEFVKGKNVSDVFLHYQNSVGTDYNYEMIDGNSKKWEHFHTKLDNNFVKPKDKIPTLLGDIRSNKEVLKRSLDEIDIESANVVLELIYQNSLYRGEENKRLVETFIELKKEYEKLVSAYQKHNFCWVQSLLLGGVSKIRNTSIGTLLVDITEGKELDVAVASFEQKVAPTNYKRPTAVATKSMIENAQKTFIEMGYEAAQYRRHATQDDITINNVIYADRSVKKAMNAFDAMIAESSGAKGNMNKVDEIDIDTFINGILPNSTSIEIMVENKHVNNLMTLIAPVHKDSKNMLKWDNNFSWSYNGELTDSIIKERVKKAGGNTDGPLRVSLSWYNHDDLDIHVKETKRKESEHIYFGNKQSYLTTGFLDVDMNAGYGTTREPVENVVWIDGEVIKNVNFSVGVNNFSQREKSNVGFEVEIEYNGKRYNYVHSAQVPSKHTVDVTQFSIDKDGNITFDKDLNVVSSSKDVWGVKTHTFHKVKMIMNSPNHWDGNAIGNKHVFFIIDGCVNPDSVRGFYNEFLNEDLNKHRKVFELLGNKLKVDYSPDQLSGVGFSSTKKDSILVRVEGSFSRTLKVNF